MEQLADNGNGIYFYIDGPEEARRAFLHTVSGSLLTIAKDVKVQVEFNPKQVKAYRLIGYENRMLADTDFSNDTVDAGELGAGLSVTALFEIIPAGSDEEIPEPLPGTIPVIEAVDGGTDDSSAGTSEFDPVTGADLLQIRIRYKEPDAQKSQLIVGNANKKMKRKTASLKFNFAAAVSEFAMLLRHSQYLNGRGADAILDQVEPVKQIDGEGAIAEFAAMIETYLQISQ
jgi:Ca-activated chloride channel family protein